MKDLYDKLYIPLSDDQIRKLLPDVPIVRYEELDQYETIEHLLPNARSAIVLFVAVDGPSQGHWTALMRSNDRIMYFCSYGTRPDKNLLWAPKYLRKTLGQNIPYLSYLLNKAIDDGFKVSFNEVKYQSPDPSIQTCGRWVVSRIQFNQYEIKNTPNNYKKLIKKYMKEYELSSDLVICKLVPI